MAATRLGMKPVRGKDAATYNPKPTEENVRRFGMIGFAYLGLLLAGSAWAVPVGQPAPALRGTLFDSQTAFDLTNLRGKVVYVDFWASWCAPCRVSLPRFNALRQQLVGAGLEVVGVSVEEDATALRRAVQQAALRYPVLQMQSPELAKDWQVPAMPTGYLLDRSGRVRSVHLGFRESEFPALRQEIEKLLKESTP